MQCKKCKCEVPNGRFCCCCGWDQSRLAGQLQTFGDVFQNWSNLHYRRIGTKSKETYDGCWSKLQSYQDVPITQLTTMEYQEMLDKHTSGQSKSSQRKMQIFISQLCKHAMMLGLLQVNFATFLLLDGYESAESTPFTIAEIATIQKYAENKKHLYWQAARITLCLIFTGFRPNEFFSLQQEHIHFKEGFMVGGSKTKAGKNRVVPILPMIHEYIFEWCMLSCTDGDASTYLVKSQKGQKINLRNWRTREFYPLMAELGINDPYSYLCKNYNARMKPYSARHTFATLAYQAGVHPETIKKIVGHVSFDFTSKIYIHSDIEYIRTETSKIVNFLAVKQ